MKELVPTEFYLSQNYPNPFKDKTTIKYCVAYRTNVKITITNREGEMIETLIDEEKEPGTYEVEFNSHSGLSLWGEARNLSSGVYFYQLKAGKYSDSKKMLLIK